VIVYETRRVLAYYHADTIIGQSARVWEVVDVEDKERNRRYVLKYVWTGKNNMPEGITMKLTGRNIRRWIARNPDGPNADEILPEDSS
jgi:hypothetical protein